MATYTDGCVTSHLMCVWLHLTCCEYIVKKAWRVLVLMMKLTPHRAFRASALEMAVSKCRLVSVLFLSVFLPRPLTSMTEDLLQVFIVLYIWTWSMCVFSETPHWVTFVNQRSKQLPQGRRSTWMNSFSPDSSYLSPWLLCFGCWLRERMEWQHSDVKIILMCAEILLLLLFFRKFTRTTWELNDYFAPKIPVYPPPKYIKPFR